MYLLVILRNCFDNAAQGFCVYCLNVYVYIYIYIYIYLILPFWYMAMYFALTIHYHIS